MRFAKTLLVLCLFFAATGLVRADEAEVPEDAPVYVTGARTIDAEQVVGLIGSEPKLVIIDARQSADFKAAAIEGAVNILNTEMTPEKLAAIAPSKTTPLLIYCNGLKCGRAYKAVVKAVSWGYSTVYYYARGLDEWKAKGLPLVKRP